MRVPQVIDLSHHNTVKSLHGAAASGIVGVIHKATEGLTYVDPKCVGSRSLAADAGMLWGTYHFLRPGNIKEQAKFFLSHVELWDPKTLLALDFEVNGVSADDLSQWLQYVESQTGQKPVLYSGSYLKALKDQERLASYRLWLAQYGPRTALPKGFNDYFLWQYSDSGEVPGIDGKCDVNVSKMTNAELRQNWLDLPNAPIVPANNPVTPTEPEPPIASTAPAIEKTMDTATGDPADAVPVKVSKNGPLANWLFAGGGLSTLGTMLWGFIQGNLSAIAIGIICLTVLILAIIFRGAITDAIRMQSAADPNKYNVK